MPARRKTPPPKKRKRLVHFEFKTHGRGDRASRIPRGTKLFVAEDADGTTEREISLPRLKEYLKESNDRPHLRSLTEELIRAKKRGTKVVMGEKGTEVDVVALGIVNQTIAMLETTLVNHPAVENIKELLTTEARRNEIRHRLIQKTIQEAVKKGETPIASRYGTAHSLLSSELKKEGIYTTRKISPQLFSYQIEIIRKIQRGTNPSTIPDIEYKRAGTEMFIYNQLAKSIFGKGIKLNDSKSRFLEIALRELIRRLDEPTLDQILREKGKRMLPMVLQKNGITHPTKEAVEAFLKKHSVFYRRQMEIERMRRKRNPR